MKVYAKQVPPEYQQSPLFMEDWPANVFVFGNRDFTDHSGRLDDIRRGLENIADTFDEMQRGAAWTRNGDLHAAIWYELPRDSGAGYTRAERLQIVELAIDYCGAMNSSSENDALCAALELVTGQKYEHAQITGSTQSDWNNVIYPAEYGREWLCIFEAEYFNTGDEWEISENAPESIDCYYFYTHEWSDDGKRAEIAAAAGVDPGDVILYTFTGWSRTPEYMEVS